MSRRDVVWSPNPGPQTEFLATTAREVLYGGAVGGGKATRVSEGIVTPYGFRAAGDLHIGDRICSPTHGNTQVIGIYPQGEQRIYRVGFADGGYLDTTGDHIWLVWRAERGKDKKGLRKRLMTTRQIRAYLKEGYYELLIPLTQPVQFTRGFGRGSERIRSTDPYTLGVLLGDGSLNGDTVQFSSWDSEIVERVASAYPVSDYAAEGHYGIADGGALRTELDLRGLRVRSEEKGIPECYKFLPIEKRFALARGLMDTDGCVDRRGHVGFTSVSKRLAHDVAWLVRSLGFRVTVSEAQEASYRNGNGEKVSCQDKYRLYIQGHGKEHLFSLPRKRSRCTDPRWPEAGRRIESVEEVDEDEAVCIKVDNPNGLYVAGESFTVTHNTDALIVLPLRWAANPKLRAVYLRRLKDDCRESVDRVRDLYPRIMRVPSGYGWHETEYRWRFPAGGFLQFGYAQHEADIEQFKTSEYNLVLFDELTEFCHHPDTEVLTRSGWKPIAEVEVGEEVLSLNEDWSAEYAEVKRLYTKPFNGELLKTRNECIRFAVTPQHRLVIEGQRNDEWRVEPAEDLPSYPLFPFGHEWVGSEREWLDLEMPDGRGHGSNSNSVNRVQVNVFVELLGWYLSEGSAFLSSGSPCVSISQTGSCEELHDLMLRLPWRSRYTENEGYRIFSRQLYDHLKLLGNTYEKRVPRWVLELPKRQLRLFFDAFAAGDGHAQPSGAISFGLANEGLIDDLQEIAAKLGHRATKGKSEVRLSTYDRTYPVWRLNVHALRGGRVQDRPHNRYWEPYRGPVYCFSVEPNHTFLCRYEGRMFWSGNTAWQYLFMFTRNRSKDSSLPTLIRAATNPGGPGMSWVDERFLGTRLDGTQKYQPYRIYSHRQSVEGLGEIHTTRQYIPSTVFDNPKLPNVEEYIAGLANLPDAEREAMLYGRWGKFRGQYFKQAPRLVDPGIKREQHGSYFVIRCMDYGWSDPSAVLWLVVYSNGVVEVAGEVYETQTTTDGLVTLGRVVEADLGLKNESDPKLRHSVLSPDAFTAGQNGEPSIAHLLGQRGWWFTRANSDRISGWHQIARLIEQDRLRVWRSRAPNLMRTLTKLPHDPNDPRDVKKRKVEDHAPEALRYGCMALAGPEQDEDSGKVRAAAAGARSRNRDEAWPKVQERLEDYFEGRESGHVPGLGVGW